MNIAKKVRKRRLELGLTVDQLASLAGYNGRGSIANIEAGREVSDKVVYRLAGPLQCSPEYLMGTETSNEDSSLVVIAKKIKNHREALNLTCDELARRVGISLDQEIRIEEAIDRDFDFALMYKIGKELGVHPLWLFDNIPPLTNFSTAIKVLRMFNKKTPDDIASEFGIDVSDYLQYENGAKLVPYSVMDKVCNYYNVTPAYLIVTDFEKMKDDPDFKVEIRMKYLAKIWMKKVKANDFSDEELEEIMRYSAYLVEKRNAGL